MTDTYFWKIGETYDIYVKGQVNNPDYWKTFRLTEITEHGLLLFTPLNFGKCEAYKKFDLNLMLKKGQIRKRGRR